MKKIQNNLIFYINVTLLDLLASSDVNFVYEQILEKKGNLLNSLTQTDDLCICQCLLRHDKFILKVGGAIQGFYCPLVYFTLNIQNKSNYYILYPSYCTLTIIKL